MPPALNQDTRRPTTAPRLLHTMLRGKQFEDSLTFYVGHLGMRLLRRKDFVGYGEESDSAVIELTHNWKADEYSVGTAFGHIAIGVSDVYETARLLQHAGVRVTRPPGPLKGDPSELIAFVEDPDGYKVELVQFRASQPEGCPARSKEKAA